MNKIPFEKTIAGAYRFFFRNIVSMLGIGWFPILLCALICGCFAYWLKAPVSAVFGNGLKDVDGAQVLALLPALGGALLLVVISFSVAIAMIYVGMIRKQLGLCAPPMYFFFSLDTTVWRMVGAYFMISLISIGILIAAGAVITAITLLLSTYSQPLSAVVAGALVTIGLLWGYYALIRVQFFLPVIVVAENHIGIARAWAMSRGNFWRILGILLIMTLPAGMAVSTITSSFMQMYLSPMDPRTAPEVLVHNMLGAFAKIGPAFVVVELIYLIVISALVTSASSNAYRLVTGGDEIAPAQPAKA